MGASDGSTDPTRPATQRGRESRQRIVTAAARLMYERGVMSTSVDDILTASGAGKSQLYHYFSGRDELVDEVLRHQLAVVVGEQHRFQLDTWDGIHAWLESTVSGQEARRFLGCPLGSIAGAVVAQDHRLREAAAEAFSRWESVLAKGLRSLQSRGRLSADTDVQVLAETTIAILQGGYLVSSVQQDLRPLRNAVAAARRELHSTAEEPQSSRPDGHR